MTLVHGVVSGGGGGGSLPGGTIVVASDFGPPQTFKAAADTNAARGTALLAAISAHVAGDTILIGPGTYDVGSTSITPLDGVAIYGQNTILYGNTLTQPLIRIVNDDITLVNLDLQTNTAGVGVWSGTPVSVSGLLIRGITHTPLSTTGCSGFMFSQGSGGGSTEHVVSADIYDSKFIGGSISGFGCFASRSAGHFNLYNCEVFGSTDGVLFNSPTGTGVATANIFSGHYTSVLDAITSGGSPDGIINVFGAYARGDQADIYGDDGGLVIWQGTNARPDYVVGNGIDYTNDNCTFGPIVLSYQGARFFAIDPSTNPTMSSATGIIDISTILGLKAGASSGQEARCGGTMFVSTTSTGNVGVGEDTLISYTVPASTLGTNGDRLVFRASGTIANNANAKRIRVRFGATPDLLFDTGATPTSVAIQWVITGEIIRTGSTTYKANVSMTSNNSTLDSSASYVSDSETLSNALALRLTGEATTNNDIVQETFSVEWHPGNT